MSDSDEYIYSTEEEEAEESSESDVEPGTNTDAGIETKTTPPTSTASSTTPTPTNAWQLVSEMTGLSANAAAGLLDIAQGDVHKACALHFARPCAIPPPRAFAAPRLDAAARLPLVTTYTVVLLLASEK